MATGNEKTHPAASIFPMMDDAAYRDLVEDMRQHGQREMIVLWKEQLLDGRNRLKACRELNIEPSCCELDDDVDPIAYVISANLHRRHLSESQRAMLGADLLPHLEKEAKAKERARKTKTTSATLHESNGRSDEKAAKQTGAGARSVAKAKKVKQDGCKQLQQAVRDDRIDVSLAERVVRSLDIEQQQEVVAVAMMAEKPAEVIRERLKQLAPPKEVGTETLIHTLLDIVRDRLDRIPASELPRAIGFVKCVLQEYSQ